MNVLIIGSGGREHALAWKAAQSPRLGKLYVAPGNAGTASCGENVALNPESHADVVRFGEEKKIDLVLVGPEAPLANGLADSLAAAGIRCFGPSRAAARIESSKAFAKDFMARHCIPTARYAVFDNLDDARAYVETADFPIVIKVSGLAAGKGVILPETRAEAETALKRIFVEKLFGESGRQTVIEERLTGQEVSLMAFTDGETVIPMPPAQDHKRIFDGDQGPNTGGMGAYAPAPVLAAGLMEEALEKVLKPAVNGLREEGSPFVGALYAGLMLTPQGIRVLEFNCRLGDPETQALLLLLQTDLLEIAEACVHRSLSKVNVRWKQGAAVCVALASAGYPETSESGKTIAFLPPPDDVIYFHAGTKRQNGEIVTNGGRVLGVAAWGATLAAAAQQAYAGVARVSFEGMQYRKDIAYKALNADGVKKDPTERNQ